METNVLNKLHDLMGYVLNGSEGVISLYQDDATKTYHIERTVMGKKIWSEYGDSLSEVINKAWEKHGQF